MTKKTARAPRDSGGSAVKIVLLAGAGFSTWACGLPLVGSLFDFKIVPLNPMEERRLRWLGLLYSEWRATHPQDHPEAFITFAVDPLVGYGVLEWYVARRLLEPFVEIQGYGRRAYSWYINSHHARSHHGIAQARQFLQFLSAQGQLDILTTNYDLIIEYALGTRGFNYGTVGEQLGVSPYPGNRRPVRAKGSVSLAKLHGSVSWTSEEKFADGRPGLAGKCLIVAPVLEKQVPRFLEQQWNVARRAIAQCDLLVTFGFSFNDYDQFIRSFFRKHLPSTTRMLFIDVVDHRRRLTDLIEGRATNYVSPLVPHFSAELANAVAAVSPDVSQRV